VKAYDIVYAMDFAVSNRGGPRFFLELMLEMSKYFKVALITGKIDSYTYSMLRKNNVDIYYINAYNGCEYPRSCILGVFKFIIYMLKVLNHIKFKIIHTDNHFPNFLSLVYFSRHIGTIHHLENFRGFFKFVEWLEIKLPRLALHAPYRFSDSVIAIPTFVKYNPKSVVRSPVKGLVLMNGRLEERKHYILALASFKVAKYFRPELQLIIVGQGPELNRIREIAKRLQIHDSVTILPYITEEEKYDLYSKAEVFLHLGHPEGFSRVVFEAILASIPTIAYKDIPAARMINARHVKLVDHNITEIARALINPPPPGGQLRKPVSLVEAYRRLYEIFMQKDQ
jgi:glycosyltransferase involved in cell wall biosynthesis